MKMGPLFSFLSLSALLVFLASGTSAQALPQQNSVPTGVVPPPLNVISKQEKTDLEAERKMKKRTKLALEFIEARLAKSEQAASNEDYQEALDQLGRFQALIRNTSGFLKRNEDNKGSMKNFKRFEISLREFIPRLELLRRELPFKYSYHVRVMMEFVRDTRADALEPFFEDTVIPEGGSLR